MGIRGRTLIGLAALCVSATAQDAVDRKQYAEDIRQNYSFHFGKDQIATPGNAAAEGNDFIPASAFPKAEYCGKCHQEAYSQWRQALHSNSFRTPFYRTSVNILLRTKGIEFTRHCDSCHNPIGVLSGALTPDSKVDREFDADGLTCMTCHAMQSVQATTGNGGFVMGVPYVTTDAKGNPVYGDVSDDEIMQHPKRHAKAVMRDLLKKPEFCASCHKANLPQSLTDYKWLRAFTAYDEWQNSKFSKRSPLVFYSADFKTCQSCHMPGGDLTLPDKGAKENKLASHRWLAGNTAVPFFYGFNEQLNKTIEFLQTGNYLNVDLFAIRKDSGEKPIAPLGSVPFTLAANDVVETMVVIQNKNIGHSLIPEVRDLYEAWVEFTVKDGSGKEFFRSGFLKPNGALEDHAHSFTNRLVNTDDSFVDNHKVWTIHSVAYDNTIQAGRSTLVRYQFRIPADAKGPLTVTARVNYRHLRQSYLNNVLGEDHPAYPVVEIAARTRTLKLGANQPAAPDPKDNPDWMRWNNLGIAYLDQFQYADAVAAFNQVVRLRPNYEDGYTNIALTNMVWEKYGSARSSLARALALSPKNARALYYLALLERRAGHPDAEVADLKEVVRQYPESRDARRDLGISYYQQHKYPEAVEQFEALQAIDSDDLTAHYNLSILYHRLGMEDKAEQQAALYAMKKTDPAAATNSLDFLREHTEISTEMESVPWHVHTDLAPDVASAPAHPSMKAAAGDVGMNYGTLKPAGTK
ncbi:MAG: tetratricopeptide repeat protein [Bryobacteraceae bacterium]|jgi:tetratricopeptide (TPR) repeat protein/mono/diheme cytochrome c family protein